MKNIISVALFLCFLIPCFGQSEEPALHYDSTYVEVRSFDQNKITDYKTDDAYDYGVRQPNDSGIWDRIKRWFIQFIRGLFYLGTSTPVGQFILYVILIVIAVFVVLRLLKVDTNIGFYRNKKNVGVPELLTEDNIHELDFEAEIKKAVSNKEFREAIRLHYLFALKKLSDQNMVKWVPGKTNREYANELNNDALKTGFQGLSYYFDYTWYGHFDANESVYNRVVNLFNTWQKGLQ